MKKLLLLILGCMALLPGYSQIFDYNGIAYEITSESDKTCEVTSNKDISGDIIIPEKVTYKRTEYSVTSIKNHAFHNCRGLTSVEIPNSVTEMGDCTFQDCRGLTRVEIGNSITEIRDNTFSYCSSLTSVEIPNSVTEIGWGAFEECSSLTSVKIGNSVTSIGDYAFAWCSSLTSVEIPNSVTEIGYHAFFDCSSLTGNLVIPNSVTEIRSSAFNGCSELTALYIGEKVKSIGYNTFEDSLLLEEVVCAAIVPPTADKDIFSDFTYTYATLFVPESSLDSYKSLAPWRYFLTIKTLEESGVDEVGMDESETLYDIFNPNGQLVKRQVTQDDIEALAPGIYIIGGKKVIVR